MKYAITDDGVKRDELFGSPDYAVKVWNVKVGEDAHLERGMLLSGSSKEGEFAPAQTAEATQIYVIASEYFVAEEGHTITQVYASGEFNREKIKLPEGVEIATFEPELRKQNIHLTALK